MNRLQKVFFTLLLFSFGAVSAQDMYIDPYGVYNGYGPSGYGRRKNMPLTDTSRLSKEALDRLREETVAKTIDKLKKQLQLDELQVVVIKNALNDGQKKQAVLHAKEDSGETVTEEQQAALQTTDKQILSFLNKDQKEKFMAIIAERKQYAIQ